MGAPVVVLALVSKDKKGNKSKKRKTNNGTKGARLIQLSSDPPLWACVLVVWAVPYSS
jgi:hypothetical protein